MSIRVRLVLSYIAMLLVPLVLFGLAVVLISVATFGSLKSGFQVDFSHGNPIKRVVDQELENVAYMKAKTDTNPDAFLDQVFVKDLEERFHKINMGLIIRQDQTIKYMSPYINVGEAGDTSKLPAYGTSNGQFQRNQGSLWITRQQDFLFADGSKGTVFVFLDGGPFQKYLHQFSKSVIWTFLFILIATNGVLTYFVSRSIIRPLRALKRAAVEIKEGNLDFEIKPHGNDELGELSIAFEEMRHKLKKSVELQLQYEENRKELISNISHDLKTPVTAIKGYVEGIMDGVSNSPDKLDKYIRTIYNKAADMDRLIDELFLFSKLDLGKVPFQFETVDLGHYVQDCTQELQFDMEKKGVQFTLADLPQEPMLVTADRDKLRRVLLNIIENAVKYSEEGHCRITLSVIEQGGFAVIQVKDNGQGISEEALPHIFDRFYRADPSRNSATGGSGLGLAIAKQIMEEHGGRIGATSMLGRGTTVYMALPRIQGKGSEA
ncbi:two-component sensor histidine kinase [Paenibacillus pectinilyticus]|uniref:histidine kinase n=1 Tax=Paenibacillus pectinilyticus TaxID=512399 RepID=A0A1C0ZSY4_9BACL|nr:HAMP domain-containing sensor histidine kinase [Paenibacillus pectinilyticus]OCT11194.1 two-component sensor histidine kinase [Paenibacillus pectinilyticus]